MVTAINSFALKDNVAPFFLARRSAATTRALRPSEILFELVAGVVSPRFMN
jgi:hypothetical protein